MTVTFNADTFVARFPEFAGTNSELLEMYFDEACLKLNNTNRSRVRDEKERRINVISVLKERQIVITIEVFTIIYWNNNFQCKLRIKHGSVTLPTFGQPKDGYI